jgi:teichuronic acid biosynthesis glycosyltransferase TuaC
MMNGKDRRIKRICIIADCYPSPQRAVNTFVDQLVCEFADQGMDCTVIAPQSLTEIFLKKDIGKLPYYRERITAGGSIIKVYSPRFVSASAYKKGIINTARITLKNSSEAIIKTFHSLNQGKRFDAVYGHFIFPSGIVADQISKKYDVPAFFAYGENTNYTIDRLGVENTRKNLTSIKGVISVSTANAENLIKHEIVSRDIIGVFPNSINGEIFYPRDKSEMRRKYGLPENAFIAVFVGRFIEIKGPDRLAMAIEKVGSDKIKSIFIGSGAVQPDCGGILIKGAQPHDRIPELLSAADIFVLPTLAEGCCNAIIEALACRLPVISSNLPFNDDILDGNCSIRIDPSNIDDIADAIELLFGDDKLRMHLAEGAAKKAEQLDIVTRARRIVDFMESKI